VLAQRPAGTAPAVLAVAERLPFADGSFDAALAILTLHHWSDVSSGLAELRRVARRIVILSTSAQRINQLWLIRGVLPRQRQVPPARHPA
jgi:ubiquinone/menaquinone biosynthesis C-methylase UbiE